MQTEAVTIKIHSYSKTLTGVRVINLFNWGSGSSLILVSFSIGIVAQSLVL